jgi:Fe2+ or Zn2+ uptake regulation protein
MQAPEILKHFQLKKTSPRLAIIEALQSAGLPLSETESAKAWAAITTGLPFTAVC